MAILLEELLKELETIRQLNKNELSNSQKERILYLMSRKRYLMNKEREHLKSKRWRGNNQDKYKNSQKKSLKKWCQTNIEYKRKESAIYRKNNPEKTLCRNTTRSLIRRGNIIIKPCEVCGEKEVECHHVDYSFPINIKWLCHRHHQAEHNKKI